MIEIKTTNRIKLFRMLKHWSQDDLAHELKCNRQSIRCWETNELVPSLNVIYLMCHLFNCTVEELFPYMIVIDERERLMSNDV